VRLIDANGDTALETTTTPWPESRLISGQLIIEDADVALAADIPAGFYQTQIGFKIPVVESGELIFDLPLETSRIEIQNKTTP
jgi:hypothetical protein